MKLIFTIKVILLCFVVVMMSQCSSSQHKTDSINTQMDLFNKYGIPNSCNEIILKKNVSLYEYQGGLYKFIPEKDSISIIENIYCKGHIKTAIWYLPLCEDSIKILDMLSWDSNAINF